jgi:hypothetical protein
VVIEREGEYIRGVKLNEKEWEKMRKRGIK